MPVIKTSEELKKLSNKQVRNIYRNIKNKLYIYEALNEELSKRFSNYNKVTKEFFKSADRKKRQD